MPAATDYLFIVSQSGAIKPEQGGPLLLGRPWCPFVSNLEAIIVSKVVLVSLM